MPTGTTLSSFWVSRTPRLAFPLGVAGLVGIASCARTILPEGPIAPDAIQLASAVELPSDSICRTLTVTYSGNSAIAVTFPDRANCAGGVVLIPGGTPTRTGGGGRNANIPLRLLNLGGYALRSPSTLVLAPTSRAVLDPAGQSATTITPQNSDSVRNGSWVWRVGASGTVPINDSSATRALVVDLDSRANSARLSFTVEADQLVGGLWPLITTRRVNPDTTKVITRPGTPPLEYYRVDAIIGFKSGVTDHAKQAFFTGTGITPLGVTSSGSFFVRIPDVGNSLSAYEAYFDALNARAEVDYAQRRMKTEDKSTVGGRWPVDGVGQRRSDWLLPPSRSHATCARNAVRAPLAWGCETGASGRAPI